MNEVALRVALFGLSVYFCMSLYFAQAVQINESEAVNGIYFAENHCLHPDLNGEEKLYCDADCCSNEDCSEEQRLQSCVYKKKQEEVLRPWICAQNDFADRNWLHVLCIFLSRTPYLGRFFPNQQKIESISTLKGVLQKEKNLHSFDHEAEVKHTTGNLFYKYDSPIIFTTDITNPLPISYRSKYLQMPSNAFGGGFCIDFSPVRFLLNRKSYCLRKLTRETCQKQDSIFSLQHYDLMNNKENDSTTFYQIAQNIGGTSPIETNVRYLCIGENTDYISFSSAVRQNKSMSSTWEEGKDFMPSTKCNLSSGNIAYATFNADKEICQNVLISLVYDLAWRGTELLNITATYVLADVPVTLSAFSRIQTSVFPFEHVSSEDKNITAYLTQYFEVRFKHHSDSDMNITSAEKRVSGYRKNSGYILGQPVITLSNNDSLDQWEDDLLYRWSKATRIVAKGIRKSDGRAKYEQD